MTSIGRGKAIKEAIERRNRTAPSDSSSQAVAPSEKVKAEGSVGSPALENLEVFDLFGTKGKSVDLLANYIRLEKRGEGQADGIHEYVVEFTPTVDDRQEKYKVLNQHENIIGKYRVFDGSRLYVPFLQKQVRLLTIHDY